MLHFEAAGQGRRFATGTPMVTVRLILPLFNGVPEAISCT